MSKKIGTLKIDAVISTQQLDNAVRGINSKLKGVGGSTGSGGTGSWGPGGAIGGGVNHAASAAGSIAGAAGMAAAFRNSPTTRAKPANLYQWGLNRPTTEFLSRQKQNEMKRWTMQYTASQHGYGSPEYMGKFEEMRQTYATMNPMWNRERDRRLAAFRSIRRQRAWDRFANAEVPGMRTPIGRAIGAYASIATVGKLGNFSNIVSSSFSDYNAFQNYRGASSLMGQESKLPSAFQSFMLGGGYKGGDNAAMNAGIGAQKIIGAYAYAANAAITGLAAGDIGPALEALTPWTGNNLYMNALGVPVAPATTQQAMWGYANSNPISQAGAWALTTIAGQDYNEINRRMMTQRMN